MATKDHDEMNLEIHTRITELNLCIEELDQKIIKLMTHEDSTKSDDEVKALKAGIEALKKDQEDVKKRFNEFIIQFFQSGDLKNLQVLTNIDEGFDHLKTRIKGYKEEEEDVNKRFNELMIEFGITKDFGGLGISTGTEEQKEEDNVSKGLIKLVTDLIQSCCTSDADLEASSVTEGHKQDMPVLISASEESEEETEEREKSEGDVKSRFLGKFWRADSSDDQEEVSSDTEDLSTNIPGLEQEMHGLMHGRGKSKISNKEGGYVKSELAKDFVRFGQTSNADLEVSTVIDRRKQDMPVLMSDSEESEEETEECKKSEGDVKSRLLEKLRGADSSDDKEEDSSDTVDFSTNIPGLEQEMRELMHGSAKSEGSKKGGGYVTKLNEAQKSRISRLEKVISDQSGSIDLNAYTSIKGLKGKIYKLMHEERKSKATPQSDNVDLGVCTNVEGLKRKRSALMHEGKEGLEKDQHVVNKRLKEWLKKFDESDEEWKALKAIKAQAIELAIKLSQQLIDLMFLMSDWKEVLAKFQEVKSLLEWVIECVIEDKNSMVICIISVMELVIEEMKKSEKEKSESQEGSLVNMEETEHKGSFYDESQIDQLLDQFLKEVLRLEYIIKHHGMPESQMLKKEVLASLKAGLDQCDKELEGIEMKLNELKDMSSFIFGSHESERNETWKGVLELKIKELWNGSEKADEENEQRE